jgi:hypothetical protein
VFGSRYPMMLPYKGDGKDRSPIGRPRIKPPSSSQHRVFRKLWHLAIDRLHGGENDARSGTEFALGPACCSSLLRSSIGFG